MSIFKFKPRRSLFYPLYLVQGTRKSIHETVTWNKSYTLAAYNKCVKLCYKVFNTFISNKSFIILTYLKPRNACHIPKYSGKTCFRVSASGASNSNHHFMIFIALPNSINSIISFEWKLIFLLFHEILILTYRKL